MVKDRRGKGAGVRVCSTKEKPWRLTAIAAAEQMVRHRIFPIFWDRIYYELSSCLTKQTEQRSKQKKLTQYLNPLIDCDTVEPTWFNNKTVANQNDNILLFIVIFDFEICFDFLFGCAG